MSSVSIGRFTAIAPDGTIYHLEVSWSKHGDRSPEPCYQLDQRREGEPIASLIGEYPDAETALLAAVVRHGDLTNKPAKLLPPRVSYKLRHMMVALVAPTEAVGRAGGR